MAPEAREPGSPAGSGNHAGCTRSGCFRGKKQSCLQVFHRSGIDLVLLSWILKVWQGPQVWAGFLQQRRAGCRPYCLSTFSNNRHMIVYVCQRLCVSSLGGGWSASSVPTSQRWINGSKVVHQRRTWWYPWKHEQHSLESEPQRTAGCAGAGLQGSSGTRAARAARARAGPREDSAHSGAGECEQAPRR